MGKANLSRQALVETIATLEAQRDITGSDRDLDRAVDTVIQLLRERLAQLQSDPGERQRRQLAVLVADLSGYTTLSEHMDVERLSDAINSMWHVLDDVIRSWGGQIDQHAGDSLMAVFGLPTPRQDDSTRALLAALAMQKELQLFNERARKAASQPDGPKWALDWPGPRMRIGLHSGMVYFARTPGNYPAQGDRQTAVGETIVEARRLERMAPAGGILASSAVYRQAQNRFHFVPALEVFPSNAALDDAYLVKGERPAPLADQPDTIAGQVTRLVGRVEPLDNLELALQASRDSHTPRLVTIVGPPGVGKSRLVYEFLARARIFSGELTLLRAGTQGAHRGFPFALVRDLLLRQFNLHPQDSQYLIEHKIRAGLAELDREKEKDPLLGVGSLDRVHRLLEQLIDAQSAATLAVEQVLAVVAPLLRAITRSGPTIAIMEGVSRADRPSLELVHRLARDAEIGPLLIIAVATTGTKDPAIALPWLEDDGDAFSAQLRLELPPLTPVESRLMASQILAPLAPPMRLIDLVVAQADGNPLYIENYIRLMIERGVLTAGDRWQIDLNRAETIAIPPGLVKLIEARVTALPDKERVTLQRAAIFGPLCWDVALLETRWAADLGETEIETALLSLEMKRYLVRDDIYSFAATQAYAFRRDTVRNIAYGTVPESNRRALHLEAAHWLIANQNDNRFSAWFPIDVMIAKHFMAAGDSARAAIWRQRSALPGTPF